MEANELRDKSSESSKSSKYLGHILLRYSAAFADWTKTELAELDRSRKNVNMNGRLHQRVKVSKLYLREKKAELG